jgi:hypothetical protein
VFEQLDKAAIQECEEEEMNADRITIKVKNLPWQVYSAKKDQASQELSSLQREEQFKLE